MRLAGALRTSRGSRSSFRDFMGSSLPMSAIGGKGHRSRRADGPPGGCQAGEGLPGGENLASRSLALRGRGHLGSLWLGLDFDRAHAAFADLLVDDLFFLHGPPRRRTLFASTL